ncbi:helicase-related protein [Bacillus massilinigeriensis]|uniref:helicase-related protein n=1 Tax=Bacillus mediterraneensis TaxID=1805474 RepID=UPI0008F89FC3|nr:helicase-related protein [Bacillus mediterraneensis]
MGRFEEVYEDAVQHAKVKIQEDIRFFLGKNEKIPFFSDYLEQRSNYLKQIWLNVWLTKASNGLPGKLKKEYLIKRGIETEGFERKLVNKLFREEIKSYKPFDVESWVMSSLMMKDDAWEKLYVKARQHHLNKEEEKKLAVKKEQIEMKLCSAVRVMMEQYSLSIYTKLRYKAGVQLKRDFETRIKYSYIEPSMLEERLVEEGLFTPNDYIFLSEFLEELTGGIRSVIDWGRKTFEYESYDDVYQDIVYNYVFEELPLKVMECLSEGLKAQFKLTHGEELTASLLAKKLDDDFMDAADSLFFRLQEEFVADLLEVAAIPFVEGIHLEVLQQDEEVRETKLQKIKEEETRKREEEEKILREIFAEEYAATTKRSIPYILHVGETNTGKTFQALQRLKQANSGLYLAPLRLLALEVYEKLNEEGVPCSLKTGEEEKSVMHASHLSSTVEMFREKDYYHVIVIDEAQMIADEARGYSWYRAITNANAREVHIIGSLNMKKLMLELLSGEEVEVIEYKREVPLVVEQREFQMNHAKRGDALVCFSRKRVLETASRLQRNGHNVSMIYGSMPPETRQRQIQRFISGESDIVVATDAIGMGLNLPIRRIVFLENEKFDGTRRRRLTSQEVKQIAGRAGRKGMYEVGKVAFTENIPEMESLLSKEDKPVLTFSVAPTAGVFERFQRYYRDLGAFFELWEKFNPPLGTKKASLSEERELYQYVRGTEMEARLPMRELYGFLHLPFDSKESALVQQWLDTMHSIVHEYDIPEPVIRKRTLEDLELSYKKIGLHLLFLYRLDRRTEAVYWERVRMGLSEDVHEHLKNEVQHFRKKCKRCGKKLGDDVKFSICDSCFEGRFQKKHSRSKRRERF